MRKIIACVSLIFVGITFCMRSIRSEENNSGIKGSPVFGKILESCLVYDSIDGNSINMIEKDTLVEILKDKSEKWYYVRFRNSMGWIKSENVYISEDLAANNVQLTPTIIEEFADIHFKSATNYYVWVDIDRQRVYILKNDNGWRLYKTIVCATGRNKSPTTRGYFTISDRGTWFYSERLGSGAKFWVRFNESYLFHSVAMDKQGNITDGVLGERRSSGCVRMSVEDAQWFYNNIPYGTGVFVN